MKFILLVCLSIFSFSKGKEVSKLNTYFYENLGCKKKEGKILQYDCPDFSPQNNTCRFKNKILKFGEHVDPIELKGDCHIDCFCSLEGKIECAQVDCFQRLFSGCSHFKYSIDHCCPVDSVCGPIAKCEIEGKTYQEGETVYLKRTCDVCACDFQFKQAPPFCKPRKCNDQANDYNAVSSYGAPVFFADDKCCPAIWITDEGQELVEMGSKGSAESGESCKFGKRIVKLGFGFKKNVDPYARVVPLKCECTIPPLLICEEVEN